MSQFVQIVRFPWYGFFQYVKELSQAVLLAFDCKYRNNCLIWNTYFSNFFKLFSLHTMYVTFSKKFFSRFFFLFYLFSLFYFSLFFSLHSPSPLTMKKVSFRETPIYFQQKKFQKFHLPSITKIALTLWESCAW